MKKYTHIKDIQDINKLLHEVSSLKQAPYADQDLGQYKTLVMLFFNASLRTRLSTQKAAEQLGMKVMIMNFNEEGWKLEFEQGAIMNQGAAEHIKEAAQVVSQYADIIAVRAFAKLENRDEDYSEKVISAFEKYAKVPVISLESATGHPLQALADAITIRENSVTERPKVVLTWAPHPRALPQAVANSFLEMMQKLKVDLVLTHPKGYELSPKIVQNTKVEYDQEKAFEGADFIYAKNWSSYNSYGKILDKSSDWMVSQQKMELTNKAKFMHCLPVRRNVVVEDAVMDSENSLVLSQALNRTFAAQIVLKKILNHEN